MPHLDVLQQLDVVDAERGLPKEEPAMDLVLLIQLEILVVVVDVVGQVVPLAQEGVGAKWKGRLVMGNALLLPLVKTLGDPPAQLLHMFIIYWPLKLVLTITLCLFPSHSEKNISLQYL